MKRELGESRIVEKLAMRAPKGLVGEHPGGSKEGPRGGPKTEMGGPRGLEGPKNLSGSKSVTPRGPFWTKKIKLITLANPCPSW